MLAYGIGGLPPTATCLDPFGAQVNFATGGTAQGKLAGSLDSRKRRRVLDLAADARKRAGDELERHERGARIG